MSTPPDEPFELHLPAGTATAYEKEIAEIPTDKRRYWRFQTVKEGETLASLARTWHVKESELAFVNQLETDADLSPGDSLVIPLAPVSERASLRSTLYRPRRGDTLVTIADRFAVTVQELRRWNHLRSNTVTPGHPLYVAEPAHVSYRRRRPGHRTSSQSSHSKHTSGSHPAKKASSSKKKKPS
jgi:membrane-bound lytic murein transglycosylase D